MVIQKEAKRQQDEAEKEAKQDQTLGNSAAGGMQSGVGGGMQGETIEYVNEGT